MGLNIFLQKPWKNQDSSYYRYLLEEPVEGVKYFPNKQKEVIQKKKILLLNNFLKQIIKKGVRLFYPSLPNAHFTKNGENYDLIHCAHCISMNKQPWICDIEYVGQFWAAGNLSNMKNKKRVRRYLTSNYCKNILAWSEWSKRGILREFPELKDKVKVVYPAIPPKKIKNKKSEKVKILFVGRDFYLKGGEVALKIIDAMSKKYSFVEGIVISSVPEDILKKYSSNSSIKFSKLISQKKLFEEVYPNCDIFLYPTFSDTFGFAILEAQSFGLPVIAQRTRSTHTINETIEDGKTGFLVENLDADASRRVVSNDKLEELTRLTEKLIEDKKLREKMSMECKRNIVTGKFSIKNRNKKLKTIYLESVK